MSKTVRYQKYVLKNSGGEELESINFAQTEVTVAGDRISRVVNDLASFSKLEGEQGDYQSLLQITTGDDLLEINKDYKQQQVKITSQKQQDPNFFWLPNEITEFTLDDINPFVVDNWPRKRLQKNILHLLSKVPPEPADLSEGALKKQLSEFPEMSEKLQQLMDIQSRIDTAQDRLDTQRKVDEAKMSVSDLEEKLGQIKRTLADVEDLIAAQKQTFNRLKQYSSILGENVMKRAEKFKRQIEKIRDEKLRLEHEVLQKNQAKQEQKAIKSQDKPRFAMALLALPLMLIVISGVGFFLTEDIRVLAIGLVGALLESLIYLAINSVEPEIDIEQSDLSELVTESVQIKELNVDQGKINEIKKFFIDKAWLGVLRHELLDLKRAIDKQLGDKNLGDVSEAKQQIEGELNAIKQLIDSHQGKETLPEEYYELTKTVSTLKQEKSVIMEEIDNSDNSQALKELLSKMAIASNGGEVDRQLSYTKHLRYVEGYMAADTKEGSIQFLNKDGRWEELADVSEEALYSIYAAVAISAWEQQPSLPLVYVNYQTELSRNLSNYIDAKIEQLSKLGQIIILQSA